MNNEPIFQHQGNRRTFALFNSEKAKLIILFALGMFAAIAFSALFDKSYTPRELSYLEELCCSDNVNKAGLMSHFTKIFADALPSILCVILIFAASVSFFFKKLFTIIASLSGLTFGRLISCLLYCTQQHDISSSICFIVALYFFSVFSAYIAFSFSCNTYTQNIKPESGRLLTETNIKHFTDFISSIGTIILLTIIKSIILIPLQ